MKPISRVFKLSSEYISRNHYNKSYHKHFSNISTSCITFVRKGRCKTIYLEFNFKMRHNGNFLALILPLEKHFPQYKVQMYFKDVHTNRKQCLIYTILISYRV
jgi:predicted ATPase